MNSMPSAPSPLSTLFMDPTGMPDEFMSPDEGTSDGEKRVVSYGPWKKKEVSMESCFEGVSMPRTMISAVRGL